MRILTGHRGLVHSLAFSPTEPLLASIAGSERSVNLWDLTAPRKPKPLPSGQHPLTDLAFTPDGQTIVTIDRAGNIVCHDLTTGDRLRRKPIHRPVGDLVSPRLCIAPAVASPSETPPVQRFQGFAKPDQPATCLLYATYTTSTRRQGSTLYFAWLIRLELPTGRELSPIVEPSMGGETLITDPAGKSLLMSQGWQRLLWIDIPTAVKHWLLPHPGEIYAAQFSPDRSLLAVAMPGSLLLRRTRDIEAKRRTLPPQTIIDCKPQTLMSDLTFAPGESVFATTSHDGLVCTWDAQELMETPEAEPIETWDWQTGSLRSIAYSTDAMQLAAGGQGRIVLWDREL